MSFYDSTIFEFQKSENLLFLYDLADEMLTIDWSDLIISSVSLLCVLCFLLIEV